MMDHLTGTVDDRHDDARIIDLILKDAIEKAVQSTQVQVGFENPVTRTNDVGKNPWALSPMFVTLPYRPLRKDEDAPARAVMQPSSGNVTNSPDFIPLNDGDDEGRNAGFILRARGVSSHFAAPRPAESTQRQSSITQFFGSPTRAHDNEVRTEKSPGTPETSRLQPPKVYAENGRRLRRSIRIFKKAQTGESSSQPAGNGPGRERLPSVPFRRLRRRATNDEEYEDSAHESDDNGRATATPAVLQVQGARITKEAGKMTKKERKRMRGARLAAQLASDKLSRLARLDLSHNYRQINYAIRNIKVIVRKRVESVDFASEVANEHPANLQHKFGITLGPRIVLFTDGSGKGPKGIFGAGVSYKRCLPGTTDWIDVSAGIVGGASSDDAELLAIGIALNIARCEIQAIRQIAPERENTYPTIFIITDSQSALVWLEQLDKDTTTNGSITRRTRFTTFAQILDPLARLESLGVKVEFHWTKGHQAVVEGNNRADRLAGQAAKWMLTQIDRKSLSGNPRRLKQVLMTPETSPDVMRMFRDQKEDIGLLLVDAYNSQLTQPPVLHQADRGDDAAPVNPMEEIRDAEEPGRNGGGPVNRLKRIMSPLARFVKNVTGHKRKQRESPEQASYNGNNSKRQHVAPHDRAPNRSIEVIDLTGEDDQRSGAEAGYVVRVEAGKEIIDLTDA